MHVYILATLDTKGTEADFVRRELSAIGVPVKLIDTGSQRDPAVTADIPGRAVFEAAGTTLEAVRARGDRGEAVGHAAKGALHIVRAAHRQGDVAGVLGLGGSAGTIIGTEAMRGLPLGVPKVMVSTLAAGQVRQYVGEKDIFMLNAIVDISGINRISRTILSSAAWAMAGMVKHRRVDDSATATADDKRPLVGLTMFGVTTPCVEQARQVLEAAGYETLVFHATGSGGRVMESLIRDGMLDGVLDITTTELADELVGGFLSAGPGRLTAASARGIPQVVSVGATDMVNFYARSTVPAQFADRRFHQHDAQVTLMRTTAQENALIGADIGRKVSASTGPAAILLPRRGVSALDRAGHPFDDPAARQALFTAVRDNAAGISIEERDEHINDPEFAQAAARKLLALMNANPARRTPT